MYDGSTERVNSLLDAGDIFLIEGARTETNNVAPPIQATIEPTWRMSRTTNTASAILSRPNEFFSASLFMMCEVGYLRHSKASRSISAKF
jgi:hypothetical protein